MFVSVSSCFQNSSPKTQQGDGPCARMAHASAVIGNKMYIFGGITSDKKLLNDIYILDVGAFVWRSILFGLMKEFEQLVST